MITQGEDVEIHALRKQGWSISAIARHVGLDRTTVRAYLAGEREEGPGVVRGGREALWRRSRCVPSPAAEAQRSSREGHRLSHSVVVAHRGGRLTEAAQASADRWCAEVADARLRRTDGTVVTVGEAADGQPLMALPSAFPVTLTLNRAVSGNALVSVWGNRYSVPPELAGAQVVVTHRCGTDSLEVHTSGRVAATHRLAPAGAHRTIRHPHHTEALQNVVLAAFSTPGPCRPKANRPPSPQATAIAARLSAHVGADPAIDLDVYRRLTQPEAS